MSEKKGRPPALAAFLVIGIAFITIGVSGNSAFIPIGCAFIVIGVAGIARSKKALRDAAASDERKEK
jgi:hypothetical protein